MSRYWDRVSGGSGLGGNGVEVEEEEEGGLMGSVGVADHAVGGRKTEGGRRNCVHGERKGEEAGSGATLLLCDRDARSNCSYFVLYSYEYSYTVRRSQ